ncbi:MAG: choice-of-anchor tandem repeat GloVer-containing protein [Candidatus Korobacteraceae bacterium]
MRQDIGRMFPTAQAITIAFALVIATTLAAQAQTFSLLYTSGIGPEIPTGLTIDSAGALYGTTLYSDNEVGGGTVFQLTNHDSGWKLAVLYTFPDDTWRPSSGVILGANGGLYGTTQAGGQGCDYGCGTIFKLLPPVHVCATLVCSWQKTTLYSFQGGADGQLPNGLVFDHNGNLYGTTYIGGANGKGTVFELTPSGNEWTKTILHSFDGVDGANPYSGVILDDAGNLYGTTYGGGSQDEGVVYELTSSGSGWTEQVLHNFANQGDGAFPAGGLVRDPSGNLYGTTLESLPGDFGGAVFELMPSGSDWNFIQIYVLAGQYGPEASLTRDAAGNLYGTTAQDGQYDHGNVFRLSPNGSGGWIYTSLHDFDGADGDSPDSSVIFDGNGNLYGVTVFGGLNDYGVVFEITP